MSERKGVTTDERRAKEMLILKYKDLSGNLDFQNKWQLFLNTKVYYDKPIVIVEKFIKFYEEKKNV